MPERRFDREAAEIVGGAAQARVRGPALGACARIAWAGHLGSSTPSSITTSSSDAPREQTVIRRCAKVGGRPCRPRAGVGGHTHPSRETGVIRSYWTGAPSGCEASWGNGPQDIRLRRVIRDPEGHDPGPFVSLGWAEDARRVRPRSRRFNVESDMPSAAPRGGGPAPPRHHRFHDVAFAVRDRPGGAHGPLEGLGQVRHVQDRPPDSSHAH